MLTELKKGEISLSLITSDVEYLSIKDHFKDDLEYRKNVNPAFFDCNAPQLKDTWSCEHYAIKCRELTVGMIILQHERTLNGAQIHLCVFKEHRNLGLAIIASAIILQYFFEYVDGKILHTYVYEYNTASNKIQSKFLHFDGRVRQDIHFNGKNYDRLYYSLTREEYFQLKEQYLKFFIKD